MATPAASLHRVSERYFVGASGLDDDGLRLALAPALTPDGVDDRPAFFRGTVAHPQVLARALVTLADITSTRYFQYAATPPSDPTTRSYCSSTRSSTTTSASVVPSRAAKSFPRSRSTMRRWNGDSTRATSTPESPSDANADASELRAW